MGEIAPVTVALRDLRHSFKRGHRFVVEIERRRFPLQDRNPQSSVDSIFTADEDDSVEATHRVHRLADHPPAIVAGVLD